MNEHERPFVTEANKTAVRAGSAGHNVRYIASCALVIIAFIAIALFVKP